MIKDSLNLVGDEELEGAIEAAFDVRFTDSDLMNMVTVGAINDVINVRLPARPGACETTMTFYRLRRALIGMGMTERIGPNTPLPSAFSVQTNTQFRALSRASDLALPPTDGGPLAMGSLLLGSVAMLSFLVGLVLKAAPLGWLALGAALAGIVLAALDPGRLPSKMSTVGALARRTAPRNFRKLVMLGAKVNDGPTWQALRETIADVLGIEPEEIGRETLIYPPKKPSPDLRRAGSGSPL